MARENKTKYAVLGLIANRPGSGYDIKKRFEQYVGKFWSESYGQIYPIAKELVDEQLVTKSTVENSTGRPERVVYTITEKGREELRNWLRRPPDPHKERLEVLLRLMCGSHIDVEDNIRLITAFKHEWQEHLETYSHIETSLRSSTENVQQLPYWLLGVSCGMHLGRAYLDWCDEALAKLEEMKKDKAEAETVS